MTVTRRQFIAASSSLGLGMFNKLGAPAEPNTGKLEVLVWDERQPGQKLAYSNFLGNEIAAHLRRDSRLSVHSTALDDPEQGLSATVLDRASVLIWWGHVRNSEITPEKGRQIVSRILAGKLSLIALHSAHWSTPFVEAMNERSRRDLAVKLVSQSGQKKIDIKEIAPPSRYTVPKRDARRTPFTELAAGSDGIERADLHLPYCCFPAFRSDGKPSEVTVKAAEHPIASGIPARFVINQTEMYDEPFHVPEPDTVIFEEHWPPGEWFRSGMVWDLGKGKVFYFRPGHETYPVFKNEMCLKVLTNAVHWLGTREVS